MTEEPRDIKANVGDPIYADIPGQIELPVIHKGQIIGWVGPCGATPPHVQPITKGFLRRWASYFRRDQSVT